MALKRSNDLKLEVKVKAFCVRQNTKPLQANKLKVLLNKAALKAVFEKILLALSNPPESKVKEVHLIGVRTGLPGWSTKFFQKFTRIARKNPPKSCFKIFPK